MNPTTRQQLMGVSTATLCTALYKRGLRQQFIQDVHPLNPGLPNMVSGPLLPMHLPPLHASVAARAVPPATIRAAVTTAVKRNRRLTPSPPRQNLRVRPRSIRGFCVRRYVLPDAGSRSKQPQSGPEVATIRQGPSPGSGVPLE